VHRNCRPAFSISKHLFIQPQTAFLHFISSFHSQPYRRWCLRHLHCLLSCRNLLYIQFVKQLYYRIGPVAVLLFVGTWSCCGIVVCRYLVLLRYCCLSVPGPVAVLLFVGTWSCCGVVCRYLVLLRCCLSVPGPVAVLLFVGT
jgi:hypothetical protein